MNVTAYVDEEVHRPTGMPMGGTPEETALRVEHMGECWIVENCMGESLGDSNDREAAIELARSVSETQDASAICIHALDGSVECVLCT